MKIFNLKTVNLIGIFLAYRKGKSRFFSIFMLGCILSSGTAYSDTVLTVDLTLPKLQVNPYHRPYVAIWIETVDRKPVATLALWHEKDTWLKDLRQWWRKVGRSSRSELDGVSGATRRPKKYSVEWDGTDDQGKVVPSGEYLLNIEAVREEGGRSYHRESVYIGSSNAINIPAENELGLISIH